MTEMTTTPGFTIKGWHVLAAFIAFFGVIIAVDILFISLAVRTFSGEAASNPYESGLLYNRTLAQRRQEAALGWTATIEETAGDTVQVRVTDRAGAALEGLSVTGDLERPATTRGKRTVRFVSAGAGLYRADTAPLDGAWDLRVTIRGPGETVFEAQRRLVRP